MNSTEFDGYKSEDNEDNDIKKDSEAAENRAKFGQTKSERQRKEADAALKIRRLDAHELGTAERDNRDGDPDK